MEYSKLAEIVLPDVVGYPTDLFGQMGTEFCHGQIHQLRGLGHMYNIVLNKIQSDRLSTGHCVEQGLSDFEVPAICLPLRSQESCLCFCLVARTAAMQLRCLVFVLARFTPGVFCLHFFCSGYYESPCCKASWGGG